MMMVIWVIYGYSFAFGGGTSPFWGGLGKLFLAGVTPDSTSATFSDGIVIPEYLFIAFQMTFAAITPALIIGCSRRCGARSATSRSPTWCGTALA